MKGPSVRVGRQIRRQWRCPQCGRQRTTPGSVTTLACDRCPGDERQRFVWMHLVEEQRKRPVTAQGGTP